MMDSLDLSSNPELLLEYTASECEKELLAIEGHGGKISESRPGPLVGYCLFCVRKHISTLLVLSEECVKGCCYQQPVWKEMRKWASENRDKISRAIQGGGSISDSEIEELVRRARDFRKQMEKLTLGTSRVSEPSELR